MFNLVSLWFAARRLPALRVGLIVILLFLIVAPVVAQDVVSPPTATVPPVEDAANSLLLTLTGLLAGAAALPITVTLVSLLKRLPFLENVSGAALSFGVAAVITVITWFSRRYGFETQVNASLDFLQTAIPALSLLIGNLVASSAAYKAARAADTPVVGYART